MWKTLSRCAMSICAAVVIALPISSSAESEIHAGDKVQCIFTMAECENVAGIAADSYYSTEYLELTEDVEFIVFGQGLANPANPGLIKWNTMINGGTSFNNDDVVVETFTALKDCSQDDLGLSFNCTEIFTHDLQVLPLDLMSARITVNGELIATAVPAPETDTPQQDTESTPPAEDTDKDSELISDPAENEDPKQQSSSENEQKSSTPLIEPEVSSEPENTEPTQPEQTETRASTPEKTTSSRADTTSVRSVVISSTDLTPSEDDTVSVDDPPSSTRSRRPFISIVGISSDRTASKASSGEASSAKTTTSKTVSSKVKASSSNTLSAIKYYSDEDETDSSKSSTDSSKATPDSAVSQQPNSQNVSAASSANSAPVSAPSTAGRIMIAAITAILAAAAVTVILSKKIKTTE